MSGQSRFERLETEIVEGLRRAPGAEPSSELDARILARAHAAVAKAPMRRSQPRWMSLAAGVVVLVGSGLALRIWQQLEHAPSQLDAPPAASAPMPQSRAAESIETPGRKNEAEAVAADTATTSSEGAASLDKIGANREEVAPRNTPAAITLSGHDNSAPAPTVTDERRQELAQPFPAETGAAGTSATAPAAPAPAAPKRAPMPAAAAAPVAKPRMDVAMPVPPPAPAAAPPPPEPAVSARSKVYPVISTPEPERAAEISVQRAIKKELTVPAANRDDTINATGTAMPAALSGGSAAADMATGNLSETAKSAPALADAAAEPFDVAVEVIRQALQRGDLTEARRLLQILRENYPNRRLPKDLEFADDANH